MKPSAANLVGYLAVLALTAMPGSANAQTFGDRCYVAQLGLGQKREALRLARERLSRLDDAVRTSRQQIDDEGKRVIEAEINGALGVGAPALTIVKASADVTIATAAAIAPAPLQPIAQAVKKTYEGADKLVDALYSSDTKNVVQKGLEGTAKLPSIPPARSEAAKSAAGVVKAANAAQQGDLAGVCAGAADAMAASSFLEFQPLTNNEKRFFAVVSKLCGSQSSSATKSEQLAELFKLGEELTKDTKFARFSGAFDAVATGVKAQDKVLQALEAELKASEFSRDNRNTAVVNVVQVRALLNQQLRNQIQAQTEVARLEAEVSALERQSCTAPPTQVAGSPGSVPVPSGMPPTPLGILPASRGTEDNATAYLNAFSQALSKALRERNGFQGTPAWPMPQNGGNTFTVPLPFPRPVIPTAAQGTPPPQQQQPPDSGGVDPCAGIPNCVRH